MDGEGRFYRLLLLLLSFSFWKEVKYRFTGSSQWSPRFISRSVHVIFVVDRVALGHSFLQILWCFRAATQSGIFCLPVLLSSDVQIEVYRTVTLPLVLYG